MSDIGARLREEVLAVLGSIAAGARAAGTVSNTIYNWIERGNIPADKLMLLAAAGVDYLYVLSGQRSTSALANDETELVTIYRQLDTLGRAKMLAYSAGASTPGITQTFHGPVGASISGDLHHTGDIHVGSPPKPKPRRRS